MPFARTGRTLACRTVVNVGCVGAKFAAHACRDRRQSCSILCSHFAQSADVWGLFTWQLKLPEAFPRHRTSSWLVSSNPFGGNSTRVEMERWGDTTSSRWKRGAVCKNRSHVGMTNSRQCRACLSRQTAILQYLVLTLRTACRRLGAVLFAARAVPHQHSRLSRQSMLMGMVRKPSHLRV